MNHDYYGTTFYEGQMAGSLQSAGIVLDLMFELYRPASIVDFGCGVGTWLRAARERGISNVLGIDGDHVSAAMLQIPRESFLSCDLSKDAPKLGGRYDLALSLEVAEHLPASRADSFVGDLVSAADLILFSAAVPDQGGRYHCNEQFPSYWIRLFEGRGYKCYDAIRPMIWSNEAVEYWYRHNILLFSRGRTFPGYRANLTDYDVIHPHQWRSRGSLGRALDRSARSLRHLLSRTMPAGAVALMRKRRAAPSHRRV